MSAPHLLQAMNAIDTTIAKASAPKFTKVIATNISLGTAPQPVLDKAYKGVAQYISLSGSGLPTEASWQEENIGLVAVIRNAANASTPKALTDNIITADAKSINLLLNFPRSTDNSDVGGYFELRSSTGLPKAVYEFSLQNDPNPG